MHIYPVINPNRNLKFSNVFYTDINLYDVDGNLLASSRSEIFDRQLLSRRMNRLVYENMTTGSVSEFIHDEHIELLQQIAHEIGAVLLSQGEPVEAR